MINNEAFEKRKRSIYETRNKNYKEKQAQVSYILDTIHKSKQIKKKKNTVETQKSQYIENPKPSDLKFRPIVAGPSCSSGRLKKFIDIFLQPLLN